LPVQRSRSEFREGGALQPFFTNFVKEGPEQKACTKVERTSESLAAMGEEPRR